MCVLINHGGILPCMKPQVIPPALECCRAAIEYFQGIADMANEAKGTRYEYLDIRNPDTLLIHGESEQQIREECKDLNRLQLL